MILQDKTGVAIIASVVCVLGVLLFFQGGYYPETSVLCAMGYVVVLVTIAAVWLWRRKPWKGLGCGSSAKGLPSTWVRRHFGRLAAPAVCLLIALLHAVSVVSHGMGLASLVECAPWMLAAMIALACAPLRFGQRACLLNALGWLGVASAWVGVAISAGLGQTEGTFHAVRLQFFFEYANAAGAWFACVALLCLTIDDARLSRCLMSPLTALLLTQSMGSALILAIVASGYLVYSKILASRSKGRHCKTEWMTSAICFLVQGVLAVLVFVGFRSGAELSEGVGALLFVLFQCVFYKLWPYACKWLRGHDRRPRLSRALIACSMLACVFAAMLFLVFIGGRLTQASATFAERVVQAKDALMLLAGNPLLGVGPDQWQYAYQGIQSAEYESTLVHCGYLQLGLDAGFLAPLALASLIVCAVVHGIRIRSDCPWPVLVFLFAHFFVDFDLQFAFYPALVAVLASMSLAGRRPAT